MTPSLTGAHAFQQSVGPPTKAHLPLQQLQSAPQQPSAQRVDLDSYDGGGDGCSRFPPEALLPAKVVPCRTSIP
jgi:hypothetical protein